MARTLHWVLAGLTLGLTGLGAWMVTLDYYSPAAAPALYWHRVAGLLVFALIAFKLGWRLQAHPPPPLPTWRRWERLGSTAVHTLLMALMAATPISGFLVSTAAGHGIPLAGDWAVPALVTLAPRHRPFIESVHAGGAYLMLSLVAVHAAAALKHHLIDRDATLSRMLFGRGQR